jgi:alkylhydroperoxidase family enzyme
MLGRSVGLSDEEIGWMSEAESSPRFDATDRLVIRYAEVLTQENRIDEKLYAELAETFPREELVELCMAVGLAALVNRVHATFRTDLDGSTQESVGDAPFCPIGR